jgi:hypothetical protein
VLVSLVSVTTFLTNGYSDDWVLIKSNDNVSEYYNLTSINIDKENKIIEV